MLECPVHDSDTACGIIATFKNYIKAGNKNGK